MKIQVSELRLLPERKPLRAFCDVRFLEEGILIRDFRIYQSNGKPSVRNPFTSYKDFDGNLKFRQIVDLPSAVQSEINAMILSEYYRRLKEKSREQQPK